jgi:hypothetical protein
MLTYGEECAAGSRGVQVGQGSQVFRAAHQDRLEKSLNMHDYFARESAAGSSRDFAAVADHAADRGKQMNRSCEALDAARLFAALPRLLGGSGRPKLTSEIGRFTGS